MISGVWWTLRMGSLTNNMKHFLIITNTHKDEERRLTEAVLSYISEKGGVCHCFFSEGEQAAQAAPEISEIPKETECALVLGGDGTLIRAATRLVRSRIPLIGVNLGTLGYLCELEESSVFGAIDRLMADDCLVEQRMMLEGYGIKAGARADYGIALNDVVIHRTGPLSMVRLRVLVNGEYLNTFCGDGLILSTPTGSTGYNMSAGGPIVEPKAQMILITPINPHNLGTRSIVIGAEDEVAVELVPRRHQQDETVEVSFDGDNAEKLLVGDRVVIRRAQETARICRLSNESFLEILGKKMRTYT